MKLIKRLFSARALIRSLQIVVGIAVVYGLLSLALIYWPSPAPFTGADVVRDQQKMDIATEEGDAAAAAQYREVSLPMRDGESLFARQYDSESSTTIVLMHGIANTSSALDNAARSLREATAAAVIAPDFRGHGRSGGEQFDVDYIGQYEDDLEDIIRLLEREQSGHRIIVAGHSMGGGVAMRYALKDDAPVPDAYLLFAPNFGEGPTQKAGDESDGDAGGEASSFVHFNLRRMIGIIMLNSIAIRALDDLPILYFNSASGVMEYRYRAVMSAQPIRPATSDIALQAVRSPLLVIVGSNDEVFRVEGFEPLISENSDGQTVIVPGPNHDGVLNDPATFRAVAEWYASLP